MKIAIVIAILYLVLNIFAVAPTVTVGDTSELTGAAVNYGIAHAPGYPLFCNVYKIFSFILPFGDPGYKLNIVSLLLGSLTIVVLYLTVFKLTNNKISAVISVLYLLAVETIIKQNQLAEVFALNNIIIVLMLFVMLTTKYSFEKKLLFISFLFGLGIGNQHIILFFVPAIIYWFILEVTGRAQFLPRVELSPVERFSNYKTIWRLLFLTTIFFVLGFSIYLFVPLRSIQQPLYDWEDPQTIDRLIFLFSRGRYGTLSLAQGGRFSLNFEKIYSGIRIYFYILGIYGSIIFFISLISMFFCGSKNVWQKIKEKMFFLIGAYFLGPFLITMSGLTIPTPGTVYILERLITSSIIFVAIFVGINNIGAKKLLKYGLMIILFYFCVHVYAKNFDRKNFFLYDYVKNIFRNVPYNSLIFSDRADESEFGITYFQRITGIRKDIKFIDCNASVTRSIYGDEYYRIWGEPRLKIRTQVESEIIKSIDNHKQVFYNTVLPEQTGIKKFKFGLLHSVVPLEQKIYSDIFVLRESRVSNPRIEGLQITNLELLGNYYLEQSIKDKKMFVSMKDVYDELFVLTGNVKYRLYLPYYYFSTGQLSLAEGEYKKLLNYPLTKDLATEIFTNLGVVCENQKKYLEAEKWYKESLRINPEFEQAYYNLAVVYWKIGKMSDALKMFSEVVKLNPQNSNAKKYIEIIKSRI